MIRTSHVQPKNSDELGEKNKWDVFMFGQSSSFSASDFSIDTPFRDTDQNKVEFIKYKQDNGVIQFRKCSPQPIEPPTSNDKSVVKKKEQSSPDSLKKSYEKRMSLDTHDCLDHRMTPLNEIGVKKKFPIQKKSILFYLLIGMFLLGLLYGSAFLQHDTTGIYHALSNVKEMHLGQTAESTSFLIWFKDSWWGSGVFLLIIFLSGSCMIAQPVAFLMPFIRGLGIGSYMGYLYVEYGKQGVVYSVLTILPGILITTLVIALASREAIRLSNRLLLNCCKQSQKPQQRVISVYIKRFLVLLCLLAVSATLDAGLRMVFSGVIELQ